MFLLTFKFKCLDVWLIDLYFHEINFLFLIYDLMVLGAKEWEYGSFITFWLFLFPCYSIHVGVWEVRESWDKTIILSKILKIYVPCHSVP